MRSCRKIFLIIFTLADFFKALSQELTVDSRYTNLTFGRNTPSVITRLGYQSRSNLVADISIVVRPEKNQLIQTTMFGKQVIDNKILEMTPFAGYRIETQKHTTPEHAFVLGCKGRVTLGPITLNARRVQLALGREISADLRTQVYAEVCNKRLRPGVMCDLKLSADNPEFILGPIVAIRPWTKHNMWAQIGGLINQSGNSGIFLRTLFRI